MGDFSGRDCVVLLKKGKVKKVFKKEIRFSKEFDRRRV